MMSDFRVGRGGGNIASFMDALDQILLSCGKLDHYQFKKKTTKFLPLKKSEFFNIYSKLLEFYGISKLSDGKRQKSLHLMQIDGQFTYILTLFFYYRTFQLPVQRLLCVHQWIQWTTLWKTCFQHTVTSYYILCSSIQKFATVLCKEPYDRAALTQGKNSGTFCNPLGCLFDFLPEQFSFHLMESFVSLVYL